MAGPEGRRGSRSQIRSPGPCPKPIGLTQGEGRCRDWFRSKWRVREAPLWHPSSIDAGAVDATRGRSQRQRMAARARWAWSGPDHSRSPSGRVARRWHRARSNLLRQPGFLRRACSNLLRQPGCVRRARLSLLRQRPHRTRSNPLCCQGCPHRAGLSLFRRRDRRCFRPIHCLRWHRR